MNAQRFVHTYAVIERGRFFYDSGCRLATRLNWQITRRGGWRLSHRSYPVLRCLGRSYVPVLGSELFLRRRRWGRRGAITYACDAAASAIIAGMRVGTRVRLRRGRRGCLRRWRLGRLAHSLNPKKRSSRRWHHTGTLHRAPPCAPMSSHTGGWLVGQADGDSLSSC